MNNPNKKLFMKLLISTALSATLLMTGFELIKQLLHEDITLWQSHAVTIAFTTLVVVSLTYLALVKHHSLLKILSGFIPICAWCKKIRDEKGDWISFEAYIGKRSSAEFTHGVCPECANRLLEEMKSTDET